jgi:peptidoglycan L-alanyl-D-glutamate endopeptidase CwlK
MTTPHVSHAGLLPRDRERLRGVHPDLVRVIERARGRVPFIVTEGLRTRERQVQLVARGASRTMHSRHLTGHAVDLAYWLDDGDGVPENGEVRWDWPLYAELGAAVKAVAAELGIPIIWGGDWPSFRDGPHFELDRKHYP